MSAPEETVELLDVRTLWKDEALNFTPWLAKQEHLNLLGAELGLRLECAQTEVRVGSMRLDILAKERDTGALVAIENQLEESDLGHLGQLLTYATGLDARVAIWVAPAFYHEYAQALHKLNQWTRDGVRFYGVKIELVRKAGGKPQAPLPHGRAPGRVAEGPHSGAVREVRARPAARRLLPAADRQTHPELRRQV